MDEPARHDIEVGTGDTARRIAVLARRGRRPAILWCGGLKSDMTGTKAAALDAFAAKTGRAFVRFDYSGHGRSGGRFEDATMGRWLEEAEAVAARFAGPGSVVVGSSMGGWIALLLALRHRSAGTPLSGLVLIAPAVDMTERLMWQAMSEDARRQVTEAGVWHRPSAYGEESYPITRALIEEGRAHLLLDRPTVETGCPVRILHGRDDGDVPLDVSLDLVTALSADDVTLTVVHDGDHRLSRQEDIALLLRAVEATG